MTRMTIPVLAAVAAVALVAMPGGAQSIDGRALYLKNCRSCHGTTGRPSKQALRETPKIPTIDQEFLSGRSDDSLTVVVTRGTGKDMKSFKEKLTAQEIDAVVKYVRTLGTPKD